MDDEISAAELEDLLDSDGAVRVIDTRAPGAFAHGHIPGSENVPFGELTARIEEFNGDERVVTVCPHGEASVQAARLIDSYEGFSGRVESLACGVEGWEYGLEADDGGKSGTETETDGGPEAPF